jgi:hypothetical protein
MAAQNLQFEERIFKLQVLSMLAVALHFELFVPARAGTDPSEA